MGSRSKWEKLISDHNKSGLTQKRFCEERGLNAATFAYWKSKLKKESFIELPIPFTESALEPDKESAKVELELPGGAVLRLSW